MPRRGAPSVKQVRFNDTPAKSENQLSLFNGWFVDSPGRTHTHEIFDAMPKYLLDRHAKVTTQVETLRRSFLFRDAEYTLRIAPAILERGKGDIGMYPGIREELVFRAILHMAVQQHVALQTNADKDGNLMISAAFTLSQLRKHLRKSGHEFPIAELDEALLVSRLASYDLRQDGDSTRALMSSGLFMLYSAYDQDLEARDDSGEKSYRYVVFNPLITRSILEKTFRAINYERLMSLNSPVARWIYERISHNYTQAVRNSATLKNGYTLSLETVLRESGITAEKRVRDSINAVRKALKELCEKKVLDWLKPYDEKLVRGEKPKRGFAPVVNAIWTLYPSNGVVGEIVEANQSAREYNPSNRIKGRLVRRP